MFVSMNRVTKGINAIKIVKKENKNCLLLIDFSNAL